MLNHLLSYLHLDGKCYIFNMFQGAKLTRHGCCLCSILNCTQIYRGHYFHFRVLLLEGFVFPGEGHLFGFCSWIRKYLTYKELGISQCNICFTELQKREGLETTNDFQFIGTYRSSCHPVCFLYQEGY